MPEDAFDGGGRRVVIVGGGVAGLCAGYYLIRRGFEVTLVDAASIGAPVASSYGNGGWICPAQAGPLPEPGLTIYGLRALLRRDSSLYFNPRYLPRLAPWLLRFRTYCNAAAFERGTAALAELGRDVFDLVDEMVSDGLRFELHKMGMLIVGTTHEGVDKAVRKLEPMRRFGYEIPTELLSGGELESLEPTLSERVKFAALVPQQWHVRADTFVTSLGDALRRKGAEIVEHNRVTSFKRKRDRLIAACTETGEYDGSDFLICAGSWTKPLTSTLGVRLPIEAGKGYTFMVSPRLPLNHGVLFPEAHAGATPLQAGVRIGGTMEFSGYDTAVNPQRIETIFSHVRDLIDLLPGEPRDPWAGLRPTSVDGLPIVDRLPGVSNAFVASGYSMLGMTLSPPAGAALADFVHTGMRPRSLEAFRADRFRRIRAGF
jgi:D-amino-acid dehydrogenase